MLSQADRTRADVYRIEALVSLVKDGRVRVPDFQRNFRWARKDVLDLFDSIFKGYPVGSLLLWSRRAEQQLVKIGELRIDAPEVTDALWVVDGQQRITAIANAVSQEAYDKSETFRIDFNLATVEFVYGGVADDAPRIPLPVLFDLRRLLEWSQSRPDAIDYIGTANDAAVRLRDFTVPASIVAERDEATLREIFDRTNDAGKKLKRAEVFHALFSQQHDAGISIAAIGDELADTSFGRIDDDTVLHSILARRHADFTRDLRQEFTEERGVLLDVPMTETQEEAFQGGRDALRAAIAFLQDHAHVPHVTFLPYRYLLTTLARFFAHHPTPEPRNIDLLVRWFWRAALAPTLFSGSGTAMGRGFASRISQHDESGSVQDLLALVPDETAFIWPNVDLFRTNTAATKAMLCALYGVGPRRFSDGELLDVATLAADLQDSITAANIVANAVSRRFVGDATLSQGIGSRFLLSNQDVAQEQAVEILSREVPPLLSMLDADGVDRVASSHLVDPVASEALRAGHYDEFLQRRREAIRLELLRFLKVHMGLDLPANPPLEVFDLDAIDTSPGSDSD